MGSWPRRYGVPKIHKKDYLLKPILATIGSAQHKVAQYLSRLLQPVSDLYSVFCVKDVNLMKYFKNNSFSLKTVCLLYKVVENWSFFGETRRNVYNNACVNTESRISLH